MFIKTPFYRVHDKIKLRKSLKTKNKFSHLAFDDWGGGGYTNNSTE